MENNNLIYKFVQGMRRDSLLLYVESEKQLYKIKSNSLKSVRYICYVRNCQASVSMDKDTQACTKLNNKLHCHENQEEFKKKLEITNSIKKQCENANLKRNATRDIFDDVCFENASAAHLAQDGKMKRNLCQIKNNALPKCPESPIEIKNLFSDESILTRFGISKIRDIQEGSTLFYKETIIERDFAYSIFMSPTICETINNCENVERNYLMDATFSVVPQCGYKQLLIVHIGYLNHAYPFIFILMSNKSEAIYNHLFQYINNNLFQFNAVSFKIDFERALRNSLSRNFPSAKITGCWFHYCQALKRNSSKINHFNKKLKRNENANRLYKKFLVLPLLPPHQIVEAFNLLKNDVVNIVNDFPEFNKFIKYFEKQWMQKEGPSSFSVYKERMRTTSSLEGYHSQLAKKLVPNGNFCKFVNCLLEEDFKASIAFKQSLNGINGSFQESITINKRRVQLIEKATNNLENNKITLQHFLNHLSNWENNAVSIDDIVESEADVSLAEDGNEDSDTLFPESENQLPCTICFTNARNILLIPCNHFKFCLHCYEEHSCRARLNGNTNILCPICRQIVENYTKIFA